MKYKKKQQRLRDRQAWWAPDSEGGHNARVKAFDKLIKYYELDKKNHE